MEFGIYFLRRLIHAHPAAAPAAMMATVAGPVCSRGRRVRGTMITVASGGAGGTGEGCVPALTEEEVVAGSAEDAGTTGEELCACPATLPCWDRAAEEIGSLSGRMDETGDAVAPAEAADMAAEDSAAAEAGDTDEGREDGGISLRMHMRVQLSFSIVLPSSHCSFESVIPSPQRGTAQLGRHASGETALPGPSSHCSP